MIFMEDITNSTQATYWLGSSVIQNGMGYASYGIRTVLAGRVGFKHIYRTTGGGWSQSSGIRPAVSLDPEIVFGGNATDGWTIQ